MISLFKELIKVYNKSKVTKFDRIWLGLALIQMLKTKVIKDIIVNKKLVLFYFI